MDSTTRPYETRFPRAINLLAEMVITSRVPDNDLDPQWVESVALDALISLVGSGSEAQRWIELVARHGRVT